MTPAPSHAGAYVAPPHETAAQYTVDAFHRGAFFLAQPARGGHRAGMDALVLAASVPAGFAGRVADLGAGAGAAGLAVLSRCPAATALLVEQSPEMTAFARQTLALPENQTLAPRAEIVTADVKLRGAAREAAGLGRDSVGFAIMNPPFNADGDRASPDGLRRLAHVMAGNLFEAWIRTAAAIVRPRGGLAVIARPVSLPEIVTALEGRFGGAQIVPVHPRADEPAIRIVIRTIRGSRAPLALMPPLVLHEGQGFTERATAISEGRAGLFEG